MKRAARLGKLSRAHSMSKLKETRLQPLRPLTELRAIERDHGSACKAAFAGELSAEEFLKLEFLNDRH